MPQAHCIFKWLTIVSLWASPQMQEFQSAPFLAWLSQCWVLIKVSLSYLKWGSLEHHPPWTGLCLADRNGAEWIWPARQQPQVGAEHRLTHSSLWYQRTGGSLAEQRSVSGNTLPLPGTPDTPKDFFPDGEEVLNAHLQLSQNNYLQKLLRTHRGLQRLNWSLCCSP